MGCVGGKPNDKPLPKDKDQTVSKVASVPHQAQTSSIVQPPNPPAEKKSSIHQESAVKQPQQHVQQNHNSHQAASDIKKSLNVANPDPQNSAIVQSGIEKSNQYAEVTVLDKKDSLSHANPVETSYNVIAGGMQSYVGSNIQKTHQDVKDKDKRQKSNLEHKDELQEEKVHDEGVNSFAIPIKNINLHVEVR